MIEVFVPEAKSLIGAFDVLHVMVPLSHVVHAEATRISTYICHQCERESEKDDIGHMRARVCECIRAPRLTAYHD